MMFDMQTSRVCRGCKQNTKSTAINNKAATCDHKKKKKKNPHRTNNNNKKNHQHACQHSDMASGDPFNSTVSHELRAAVYELSRRLNLLGC